MKTKLTKTFLVSAMILAFSAFLFSSDYGDGRYYCQSRYVEGNVYIQRANDSEVSELVRNMPIMAGDRIWTEDGRAEIQFDDGSLINLDKGSKLDFEAIGESIGRYGDSTLVKLWAGSIFVNIYHDRSSDQNLEIQTMAGSVSILNNGAYRFDLGEDFSLRLTVFEGLAEVGSNRGNTMVRSGQRLFLEPGADSMDPVEFADNERDDFSEWIAGRVNQYGKDRSVQYVDDTLDYLVDDMDNYGEWKYANDYGTYVWIPRVNYIYDDWRPYYNGTWVWTPHGWTFVSYDPWSWVTYRYGRWDWSPWGWCWIPGYRYSPAWVYWEIGYDYIGWAPIGYYNYPVNRYYWKQYPRGYRPRIGDGKQVDIDVNSWTVVQKGKFGKDTISRIALPKGDIAKINRNGAKIISTDYAEKGFVDRKINYTATKSKVNSPTFRDLPQGVYKKISKGSTSSGSSSGWDSSKAKSSDATSSYIKTYKKNSTSNDSSSKYIYKSNVQKYIKKDSSSSSSSSSSSKGKSNSSGNTAVKKSNTSSSGSNTQSSPPVKKKDTPTAYNSGSSESINQNRYNNTNTVYRSSKRYTVSSSYNQRKYVSSYNGNTEFSGSSNNYKKYYSRSSAKPYYSNSWVSKNNGNNNSWTKYNSNNTGKSYMNLQKQSTNYKFSPNNSSSSNSSHSYSISKSGSSHSYSSPVKSYTSSSSSHSSSSSSSSGSAKKR